MKIKILMIEPSGFGGLAYYTYCLCQSLSIQSEIDLVLLTDKSYEMSDYVFGYKVIKHKLHGAFYILAVLKTFGAVMGEKPNIIHIQSLITARKDWVLFLLARILQIPVIYTAHNVLPHDEDERTALGMKFVFGRIYKWSKAIITHSRYNLDNLLKIYDLNADKIKIIKHGNYLFQSRGTHSLPKKGARKKLGLDVDDSVILFFGAVREYKGIMDLLEAFKKLTPNDSKFRLLIVGRSNNKVRKNVSDFIKSNDLEKVVIFFNRYIKLEEFRLFFDTSDVVVLPYRHSYGSGALHTAMAFSKPVILTDLPFFREIVIENENGLFFKYGDILSLSEKIGYFFSLPREEQHRMGEASFTIASDRFRWEPIAEQTLALYKQIAT